VGRADVDHRRVTNLGRVTVAGAAASGQAVDVFVDGALLTNAIAEAGTFTAPLVLDEGRLVGVRRTHFVNAGLTPKRTSVVQVRVLDRKRPASHGTRVALDAFLVIR
jgi:hypothetical protein